MLKILSALLLTGALILNSCGSEQSGGSSTSLLVGKWTSKCDYDKASGDYKVIEMDISASDWLRSEQYYSDSSCKQKKYRVLKTESYSLLDTSTNVSQPSGSIDWQSSEVTFSVQNSVTAAQFSQVQQCEISSWNVDEERSVIGKNCGSTLGIPSKKMVYSIFTKKSGELQLGGSTSARDGSSAAARHDTIEISLGS